MSHSLIIQIDLKMYPTNFCHNYTFVKLNKQAPAFTLNAQTLEMKTILSQQKKN